MGRKATLLTNRDMKQFDVLKLVGVSDDHDALAAAEKEMAGMGVDSISATRSSPYYLDVTAAEANKGAAVLAISELLAHSTRADCDDRRHDHRHAYVSSERDFDRDGQRAILTSRHKLRL